MRQYFAERDYISKDQLKAYRGTRDTVQHRIPSSEELEIPRKHPGVDWNLWYEGDVPPDSNITGNHSNVYIEGKLGDRSFLNVRQGMVSASSIGEEATIGANILIIVDNLNLSAKSKNLTADTINARTIIEVPKEKKRRDFSRIGGRPLATYSENFLKNER
jgi:hypothetical protein